MTSTHIVIDGVVINTIVATLQEAEEVGIPQATYLDAEEHPGGVGWVWDGVTLSPPPAPAPQPAPAPTSCTPAQGLIALYAIKQLTEQDILDAIAQITDPVQRYTATIGYQRATTWQRGSATMATLAQLLGLNSADLDALFAYAAEVAV